MSNVSYLYFKILPTLEVATLCFNSNLPLRLSYTAVASTAVCSIGMIFSNGKSWTSTKRTAWGLNMMLNTASILNSFSSLSFMQSFIPQTAAVGLAVNCTIAGVSFFIAHEMFDQAKKREAKDIGLQSLIFQPLASTIGFAVGTAACMYFAPALAAEHGIHIIAGVVSAMVFSYVRDKMEIQSRRDHNFDTA